jgi:hypothetical protein
MFSRGSRQQLSACCCIGVQERARAKIPVEQRKQQVAEEFVRARQLAAQAKSSGNKAQQKETGELIRSLKQVGGVLQSC